MMEVSLLSKVTGNPEEAEALAVMLDTLVSVSYTHLTLPTTPYV